jgi:monovalent cation/hydrogen antiporter
MTPPVVHEVELGLAMLVAVAAFTTIARLLRVPAPILLVLGGLLLALFPGVPKIELVPDLVFLLFLPPLLYAAGFESSIRDTRAQLRPILSLAVGLVLATTAIVAALTHALLPGLGWPTAFALGAILSPTEALPAAAIFRRLGVPRRMITLLESESLANHATALAVYQAALMASAAAFSLGDAALRFAAHGIGGVLVGLAAGWLIASLRRPLNDPLVEISISLLTPFAAYLPAEWLGVSGVLATVTAGLCIGRWQPRITGSDPRLRERAVWEMIVFVLNGLLFLLIGLQLPVVLAALSGRPPLSLLGLGLLAAVVVILVRLAWVFAAALLPGWPARPRRGRDPEPRRREVFVVGWTGMRGVVSLAAALALPLATPERELLIFLTFCVILVTLVGQGLSLPWLVRALGVLGDGDGEHLERHARAAAAKAAAARIEQLASEWPAHLPLIDTLRAQNADRTGHLDGWAPEHTDREGLPGDEAAEQEVLDHRRIRRAVIDAERAAVLDLRERGEINDEVWRRVERDLDLEELRMEA